MPNRFKPPAQAAVVKPDGLLTAAWTAYFQDTSDAVGTLMQTVGIGAGGPTWTSGTIAPVAVQPVGSLYSRVGGAIGSTLYVSRGGGTWHAVAGV